MIVANTGREVFRAMQKIVIQRKDQTVKGPLDDRDGAPIDVCSASMVIQVHEALRQENQEKMMEMFERLPVGEAVNVLWKVSHQGHTLH